MNISRYTIPLNLEEDEYLLINSRTGACDLVDSEVISLLQSRSSEGDPALTAFLQKRGHLTELSAEEELEQMEAMCEKFMQARKDVHDHVIILTYDCNLKCPYCFLSDLQEKGKDWLNTVIDDEHIDRIFEVATKLDGSSRGRLCLYGGEPLLTKNKPVVEKILQKGSNLGYTFSIATNGTSVERFLDVLTDYPVALQITIDGPKEIHNTRRIKKDGTGTFDEIIKGVDAAVEAGVTIFLRTNLDRDNVRFLPEVADFYKKKGWLNHPHVSMHFSTVFKKSCGNYQSIIPRKTVHEAVLSMARERPEIWQFDFGMRGLTLFENVFSKGEIEPPRFWYCEANSGMLIYDPFGDIYVCWEHVGTENTRVGKYYPGLEWNDLYTQWRGRTVFTIPECRTCRYALFCGGGCGFEALEQYGTLSKPVCYDYQELFHMVIPSLYRSSKED